MYKLMKSIYNSIRGARKMKRTYTIIVHKEEDGYWAECKEYKECFVQAKTVEELKILMKQAIYLRFVELNNVKNENNESDNIELELSYA